MASKSCETMIASLLDLNEVAYSRSYQGKHIKFELQHGGQRRIIVVSKSASDHRGAKNLYGDTRRTLVALGVKFKEDKALRNL